MIPADLLSFLQRRLRTAKDFKEIDSIYIYETKPNYYYIYCLVSDHTDEVYEETIELEDQLLTKFPRITTMVHVRAHQGRDFSTLVPEDSVRV